jgi:hypothetical protein
LVIEFLVLGLCVWSVAICAEVCGVVCCEFGGTVGVRVVFVVCTLVSDGRDIYCLLCGIVECDVCGVARGSQRPAGRNKF